MLRFLDSFLLVFVLASLGYLFLRWHKWGDYFSKKLSIFYCAFILLSLLNYFITTLFFQSTYLKIIVSSIYGIMAFGLIFKLLYIDKIENRVRNQFYKAEDGKGDCKFCGHKLNQHQVIAHYIKDLSKGGKITCPVTNCQCSREIDFSFKGIDD